MSENERPRDSSADQPDGDQATPGWQQEIADLIENADLPADPGLPTGDQSGEPGYPELLGVYMLERHEEMLKDSISQHIEFDIWNLKRCALLEYDEAARDFRIVWDALRSLGSLRHFFRHEQATARLHAEDHGDPERIESARITGESYDCLLHHLDDIEARVRRLNPDAATAFDAQKPA